MSATVFCILSFGDDLSPNIEYNVWTQNIYTTAVIWYACSHNEYLYDSPPLKSNQISERLNNQVNCFSYLCFLFGLQINEHQLHQSGVKILAIQGRCLIHSIGPCIFRKTYLSPTPCVLHDLHTGVHHGSKRGLSETPASHSSCERAWRRKSLVGPLG